MLKCKSGFPSPLVGEGQGEGVFGSNPHLNQTTRDSHTRVVTLSEAKGLAVRFFAGAQNDKAGWSHRRVCQCPVARFRLSLCIMKNHPKCVP